MRWEVEDRIQTVALICQQKLEEVEEDYNQRHEIERRLSQRKFRVI